jgi:prepilin-type N-terminal cleavage/methylation domain-containing protein
MKHARQQVCPIDHPTDRDAGFSIIEIVATIAVMAILIAPLMSAVIATVRGSRLSRNLAQIETVLQNAADRVNRAPVRCPDYLVYVQAAAQSIGWPPDSASATYAHYDVTAAPNPWVAGACIGASPTDLIVQRVTITVTSPDGQVTRTLQVVKSDV